MWTAPGVQELYGQVRQGECGRMSGLLTRPGTTAAKMVSAPRVPNEPETLNAARSDGMAWGLGSPDHTISLLLEQPRPQREVVATVTLKFYAAVMAVVRWAAVCGWGAALPCCAAPSASRASALARS